MRLGNAGGKNKGKKYLKITGQETITPENRAKANLFKTWFSENYERIQIELVGKRTYDEDILNETFIRIHEKILYGGLEISNYKAYFHRAFFTNYVQDSMKKVEQERILVADEYAIDALDETLDEIEQQQQKLQLYKEVLHYVRERFEESDYRLFVSYVRLGSRKYEVVSKATNTSYEDVVDIIGKIKKSIRKNKEFMRIRQSM